MKNFLIYCSEDGDIRVTAFMDHELTQVIEDHGLKQAEPIADLRAVQDDPQYWGRKYLIIKGEIAVPKAVQTVTEWKL